MSELDDGSEARNIFVFGSWSKAVSRELSLPDKLPNLVVQRPP